MGARGQDAPKLSGQPDKDKKDWSAGQEEENNELYRLGGTRPSSQDSHEQD